MRSANLSAAIGIVIACGCLTAPALADTNACSNATLKGEYGFYRNGSTPLGPLAAIGLVRFDGHGNFSVTQSTSKNGVFTFDLQFDGTYQINADCTGTESLNGVEFARIVVTRTGQGFYLFSETAGNAVYGVGQAIGATN